MASGKYHPLQIHTGSVEYDSSSRYYESPRRTSGSERSGPGPLPAIVAVLLVAAAIVAVTLVIVLKPTIDGTPSGPTPPTPAPQCSGPVPFPVEMVTWEDCPVFSPGNDGPVPPLRLSQDVIDSFNGRFDLPNGTIPELAAKCTRVPVPMEWDPKSPGYCSRLSIFIKKVYMNGAIVKPQQLWWLPGGGGQPGSVQELPSAALLNAVNGTFEIYLVDRRGTGLSNYTECPTPLSNFSACFDYIKANKDRVQADTIRNVVRDIIHSIYSIGRSFSGQKLFLMGTSHSSYLTQRILAMEPKIADAAILDSVLPQDLTDIPVGDTLSGYLGLDLIGQCMKDNNCASHFPQGNPMRALYILRMNYDNKLTAASGCLSHMGLSYSDFSMKLSLMMNAAQWHIIPAIIHRTVRCSATDKVALSHWLKAMPDFDWEGRPGFAILSEYIADWTEMWYSPESADPGCDVLAGIAQASLFTTVGHPFTVKGCRYRNQTSSLINWSDLIDRRYWGKYPTTSIPILGLTGEYDPFIPLAWARHASSVLSAQNPRYSLVEVPYAGHTPIEDSPTLDGTICGMDLAASFLLSNDNTPVTSCLSRMVPFDFEGKTEAVQQLSQFVFGTPDLWD